MLQWLVGLHCWILQKKERRSAALSILSTAQITFAARFPMSLAILIGATIVLFVLGLLGYWRDIRHSVTALTGTLLGAVQVEFWGEIWGQDLARRLGNSDVAGVTFVVSSSIFLLTALIVGYGSSLFIYQTEEPSTFTHRLVGVLLGLLNGIVIIGYVLRFATSKNSGFAAIVHNTPLAREIHNSLPSLLLAVTLIIAISVVVRIWVQTVNNGHFLPS